MKQVPTVSFTCSKHGAVEFVAFAGHAGLLLSCGCRFTDDAKVVRETGAMAWSDGWTDGCDWLLKMKGCSRRRRGVQLPDYRRLAAELDKVRAIVGQHFRGGRPVLLACANALRSAARQVQR